MTERRCERIRFHLGTHAIVGLRVGRWWPWDAPGAWLRYRLRKQRAALWR